MEFTVEDLLEWGYYWLLPNKLHVTRVVVWPDHPEYPKTYWSVETKDPDNKYLNKITGKFVHFMDVWRVEEASKRHEFEFDTATEALQAGLKATVPESGWREDP